MRRTAARGEPLVVLDELGGLIAQQAGVEKVSPYSELAAIWSPEQLTDILTSLHRARGTRLYLGHAATHPILGRARVDPGIPATLTAAGFAAVAFDQASRLTEWRREGGQRP